MRSRTASARAATAGIVLQATLSMSGAAALKAPLVKTGPCPPLTRESFPMDDTYMQRFIAGHDSIFPLKTNFGTIQSALTPEQSINCTEAPAGLKVEMWGSERDPGNMVSIQSFTFDERGRMWAVETFDYPNTLTDPFSGHDRIVILEDADGDRVVDKQTVFATGLNIPGGIEVVPQGIVIGMSPHVVLFEDKNGDDKADDPKGRILYTGFNKGDTHATLTNLRYGLDNWLYADCGYNGGKVGAVSFGSGLLRMRLDGSKFEYFAPQPGGGNSAAFGTMEDGQIFSTAATNGGNSHSLHAVIPGVVSNQISAYGNDIRPITRDIIAGDGDKWSGFTAATGHEIYTARLFPKAYWNRAGFVTEGTGHLVNVDFLEPVGSTWTAKRVAATPNIYASSDAWSCPLQARVGPDGGVWIMDWYTPILLHNGSNGPNGSGGALINSLRNRSRERFYRVVPADGKLDAVLNLSKSSPEQLVTALGHSNMLWRLLAQKQILKVTKAPADLDKMETLLAAVLRSSWAKDEVGIDGLAVHALWTAEGLGYFAAHPSIWDPILKAALLHPSPAVRMNVARAMPRTAASALAIRDQGTVNAPEPQVRLWSMLALAAMPVTPGISIYTAYHNLDSWSKQAFTKAQAGSGIADAAGLPATPPLHAVENPVGVARGPLLPELRGALKFTRTRNAEWEVSPNGNLGPGTLTVFTLEGRATAQSSFDGRKWSAPLSGLTRPVYLYQYRTGRGTHLKGKIFAGP